MIASLQLDSAQLWQLAGWTMVHFLWLGTAAAAIALLCRLLLRSASPNLRYAAAISCFLLLAAMPIGIAAWLVQNSPPPLKGGARGGIATFDSTAATANAVDQDIIELHDQSPRTAAPLADTPNSLVVVSPITNEPSPSPALRGRGNAWAVLQQCVPYLPWLWIIGTPITFGLLAAGLVGTRRLRQSVRAIDDSQFTEMLKRVCASLRIRARVTIAVCDRIGTPVLIGILRPMILLPPAALTGWSPDEIEMVLLHELAHVRRWDNLVNLLLRCIESLLFFHPAVWLVSSWVRREREACCDAIVVARTQRPHAYAELLVALAAQMPRSVLFHPAAASAMAAGPLRSRIRRILQLDDDPMLISGKSFALMLAGLLVAATLVMLYLPTIGQAEESTKKTTESAESNDLAPEQNGPESILEETNEATSSIGRKSEVELLLREIGSLEKAKAKLEGELLQSHSDALKKELADLEELLVEKMKMLATETERSVELETQTEQIRRQKTDDRPADINFSSPYDRDVAKRAWEELGVKVVPLSNDELEMVRAYGHHGGLKLLELESKLNMKDPLILTHLSAKGYSTGIADFEGLKAALDELESRTGDDLVVLQGTSNGNRTFQYSIKPPRQTTGDSAASHPRFPSLENQKLADLAYKLLDIEVELEPLNETYLERVRKLGYDGGVLVVNCPNWAEGVRPGDILLGLHAWPTTSLKDLAEILSRNDLADLDPLKFYVLRGAKSANGGQIEYRVVTGRISVHLNDKSESGVGGVEQSRPSDSVPEPGAEPSFYFYSPTKDKAGASTNDAPPYILPTPEEEDNRPKSRSKIPGADSNRRLKTSAAPAVGAATSKESLRYDDKTFDQWRSLWKNELSFTKRTEAVKALAAFARAGYGKEATEAILDVAGEYDFNILTRDAEGKLKEAVMDELLPESGSDDLAKYWMPDLAARLKQDPEKWTGLTWNLMGRLRTNDPEILAIVQSLVADRSPDVRSTALSALIRSSKSQQDGQLTLEDQTRKLMTDALKSGDPIMVHAVLAHLIRYPQNGTPGQALQPILIFQPELVPLLFHEDQHLQKRVRGLIHHIDRGDAPKVVEQLTSELQDRSPERRLAAIHALAAVGDKAESALPSLKKLVNSSSGRETLVATYVALEEINRDESERQSAPYNVHLFVEGLNEKEKNAVLEKIDAASPRFSQNMADESAKIVPKNDPSWSSGGGGYGGGGFF